MNHRLSNIDKLTSWLDDQGQWTYDHAEHEDTINDMIFYMMESPDWHLGEIEIDDYDRVKELLNKLDKNVIAEYLTFEVTHGIYRRDNEVLSWNIGELECQLTDIYDHDTKSNCIYTDLIKDMLSEDIEQAENNSEWYVSRDYLYVDRFYDRYSAILDVDKLLNDYPVIKTTLKLVI